MTYYALTIYVVFDKSIRVVYFLSKWKSISVPLIVIIGRIKAKLTEELALSASPAFSISESNDISVWLCIDTNLSIKYPDL